MVRMAIVDDDLRFAAAVKKHAENFFTARGEPAEIWHGDGKTLLSLLESCRNFEVCLLDVEMPDINGLELSEKIHALAPDTKIILLTAYDRFALQGIRLGVYYYILKDNYRPELSRILERLCRETEENREEYYFISTEVSGYKVSINRILYLTKEKKYTVFHCLDGILYKERDSLGNVCQRLPRERFVTVNRGMIANMKHIISLERLDITMRDGSVLPVSRYEKANVLDRLAEYWRKTC